MFRIDKDKCSTRHNIILPLTNNNQIIIGDEDTMAISFIIFCLTLIDSVSVFEYSDCIALLLADHLFLKLLLFVKIIITNLLFIFFYAYIFIFRLCFHAIQHIFIILFSSSYCIIRSHFLYLQIIYFCLFVIC